MSTPKERLDAFLAAGIGYMSRDRLDALRRDFDALLAEHSAEVERLRTALKARRTKMDAAARDAALEEVATEADRRASLARRVYVGTEKAAMGDGAGDALETLAADLRASTSTPASVLSVDKVRAVLLSACAMLNRQGYGTGIMRDVARDLGVDLDAKTTRPSDGMGTQAGEDGESEPVPTAHPPGTCRVCGAIDGHPHKMSCRPSNREAAALVTPPWCDKCGVAAFHPAHREAAATARDGVARDEHDCAPSPDEVSPHETTRRTCSTAGCTADIGHPGPCPWM